MIEKIPELTVGLTTDVGSILYMHEEKLNEVIDVLNSFTSCEPGRDMSPIQCGKPTSAPEDYKHPNQCGKGWFMKSSGELEEIEFSIPQDPTNFAQIAASTFAAAGGGGSTMVERLMKTRQIGFLTGGVYGLN